MATSRKTTKERLAETRQKLAEKSPAYKQLLDRKAKRKQFFDEKISEIKSLTSAGKNREAYRVFEELPIMDQIALSVTPGFGDVIAAFEVGEFGTRAGERFAQDDVLGGLGNVALSGLAGASLLPIIGPVAGAAGKVGKSLGRVAKIEDVSLGGGSSSAAPQKKPNEYTGTKVEGVNIGLSSPNLKTLRAMKQDKEQSLIKLVTRLVKANPDKVGELRMLGVIEEIKPGKFSGDKIVLTPEVRSFFSVFAEGKDIATPAGLDLYMTNKMPEAISVRLNPVENEMNLGLGAGIDKVDGAKRRIYGVKGVDGAKRPFDHTSNFLEKGQDNTIAFDSIVRNPDEANVITVNRIQSDYSEQLGKAQKERAQLAKIYVDSPFSNNPFDKPNLEITDDIKQELDKLAKLGERFNKNIAKSNKQERLNLLFEDYGLDANNNIVKTGDSVLPKTTLSSREMAILDQTTAPANEIVKESFENSQKLNDQLEKITAMLKRENAVLFNQGFFKNIVSPRYYADYTDLAPGQARITQRNLFYDDDIVRAPTFEAFTLDKDYYASDYLPKEINDLFGMQKKIDVDGIKDAFDKLNLSDSDLVYKKDPYAKKNTSQTHKLPIRSIVNETAQNTDAKFLEIPLDRIYKAGEIMGSDSGKAGVFDYYEDIYKELGKISKELDLNADSVFKIKGDKETLSLYDNELDVFEEVDFDLDNMRINLDDVRAALAEGKTIDAFKNGGLANSVDSIDVVPVRFDRIQQALDSAPQAIEIGRSLGLNDLEILGEAGLLPEDIYLYRPNVLYGDYRDLPLEELLMLREADMLYGDFRDLPLEEAQMLREAEMERGVTRGGDDKGKMIDLLLNKI